MALATRHACRKLACSTSRQQVCQRLSGRWGQSHPTQGVHLCTTAAAQVLKEQGTNSTCHAPHVPVLFKEVLELLQPSASPHGVRNNGIRVYVDATLGAGGHASLLMEAHPVSSCLSMIQSRAQVLLRCH